ncbi:MAG TPA: hypothetical protein VET46_10605 [Steroidobacteraceae bacterium]|nr:hypothetical protein [Steroidobacteraceae bacterium]
MRPIAAGTSGEKIRDALKPADTVHVLTKSGASRSFEVTEVGATSLSGKTVKMFGVGSSDGWGTPIEIPYTDVAQIEVRRVEGLKTAILTVVLAVAADVAISSASAGQARITSR